MKFPLLLPIGLLATAGVFSACQTPKPAAAGVHRVANQYAPETPTVAYAGSRLSWPAPAGAEKFLVLKNGAPLAASAATSFAVPAGFFAAHQVIAVDGAGRKSFASEPLEIGSEPAARLVQLESVAPRPGWCTRATRARALSQSARPGIRRSPFPSPCPKRACTPWISATPTGRCTPTTAAPFAPCVGARRCWVPWCYPSAAWTNGRGATQTPCSCALKKAPSRSPSPLSQLTRT